MAEDHQTSSLIDEDFSAATEKINDPDFSSSSSSSSSDDDDDVIKKDTKKKKNPSKVNDDAPVNLPNVFRLFGRQQPLHKVLGAGKPADVFLWRDKKISAGVLGGATALWFLFEVMEYHLITLVCHLSILTLAVLFLWSNASAYLNRSAPCITEVMLPEKCILEVVSTLRTEIDRGASFLRDIASGKDLKKFLAVIAGLWVVSVVGSWFNFLTLVYIAFVLLHTVPVLYEKYEDQVDSLGEKAWIEIKKQYAVFDEKVLSQIPIGALKGKKKD